MSALVHLCSQYALLHLLTSNLSAIDLYRLSLTCSDLHVLILRSSSVFSHLKTLAICDGSGLRARVNAATCRPRDLYPKEDKLTLARKRCDESNTLPCQKCGCNVCEECRAYPRVGLRWDAICRRPHYSMTHQLQNIVCYCGPCDRDVAKRTGDDICDCDRYKRWVCYQCDTSEKKEAIVSLPATSPAVTSCLTFPGLQSAVNVFPSVNCQSEGLTPDIVYSGTIGTAQRLILATTLAPCRA